MEKRERERERYGWRERRKEIEGQRKDELLAAEMADLLSQAIQASLEHRRCPLRGNTKASPDLLKTFAHLCNTVDDDLDVIFARLAVTLCGHLGVGGGRWGEWKRWRKGKCLLESSPLVTCDLTPNRMRHDPRACKAICTAEVHEKQNKTQVSHFFAAIVAGVGVSRHWDWVA